MNIAFISGMAGAPWGGSEVLWSRTAFRLRERGHAVFASVHGWPRTPEPVTGLRDAGIIVDERKWRPEPFFSRLNIAARKRLQRGFRSPGSKDRTIRELTAFRPDLVCISHGSTACGLEWMEHCLDRQIPYVSVSQANAEWWWPDDTQAARLARAHGGAVESCFVSRGNLTLFETQIAARLPNARIIWNPFQVSWDAAPAWPPEDTGYRLACVGRLSSDKGQDLVLQVLSRPEWRERALTVSFFGHGPADLSFRRLAAMLGVEGKVRFEGQVASVESIWATHHALLLPSRCEGLPLALVESLLSGRPAIVTDVAGNQEILEDNVTGYLAAAPTVHLVAEAMERAWINRGRWRDMGATAARAIRQRIPQDPVGEFADRLVAAAPSHAA